jgi:DnaK suppressor protein
MADAVTVGALVAERERRASLVADLESDLAAIGQSTAEGPDDEHDAEGSTVGYERARVQALLAHARRGLAELDAAVQRVADGTYRSCEKCGGPIGDERLAALLTTRSCIDCAATRSGP